MSNKKSSKTSHVLNLITNRIGAPEDGEEESALTHSLQAAVMEKMKQGAASDSASASHPGFAASPHQTPTRNISHQAPGQPFSVSIPEQEPFIAPVDEDPFSWASQPTAKPDFDMSWDDFSCDEPAFEAVPSAYTSPATPPQPEEAAIPEQVNVSDKIRQELEEHLAASISPMTLQDFSDPRHRRSVEIPLNGIGGNKPHESDYAVENEEFVYINIMEELILLEYESLVERIGVCNCKRCRNDIIAIALNKLPPKYVVTKRGYLISKLATYRTQYHTDVVSTITGACLRVKKYPNHNEDITNKK